MKLLPMMWLKNDDRQFVGIEPGLHYANLNYITVDKNEAEFNTKVVETMVDRLMRCMKRNSSSFNHLYRGTFKGGSNYDGLKVGTPQEFDIDILLMLPKCTRPVLKQNNFPGYVALQLETFEDLYDKNPQLYKDLATLVDRKNYLLTAKVKSFVQNIFRRAIQELAGKVSIQQKVYRISAVEHNDPALTLTIHGEHPFHVKVDLVPCVLLPENQWPRGAFRPNPYPYQLKENSFFIVPKSPNSDNNQAGRNWRLSFQIQEREIIFDSMNLKPALKIMKQIRDNLGHKVSSYALKTIFLWENEKQNPNFDEEIPEFWLKPLSFIVFYMLKKYVRYLQDRNIWYFWNKKMNLLDNLTPDEIYEYQRDIEDVLADIEANRDFFTILKYLKTPNGTTNYQN